MWEMELSRERGGQYLPYANLTFPGSLRKMSDCDRSRHFPEHDRKEKVTQQTRGKRKKKTFLQMRLRVNSPTWVAHGREKGENFNPITSTLPLPPFLSSPRSLSLS